MPDPDGFDENPQTQIAPDDAEQEHVVDESIFGPQKVLTPEEQAEYDAWFLRKVQASLEYSKRPDAVFYSHDEVMDMMSEILEARIGEAARRDD